MIAKLREINTRRKPMINIKNVTSTKRVVNPKLVMIARHPTTMAKVLMGMKKVLRMIKVTKHQLCKIGVRIMSMWIGNDSTLNINSPKFSKLFNS
jgi:hypothetical protein